MVIEFGLPMLESSTEISKFMPPPILILNKKFIKWESKISYP